ncbi:MAG: hypothetical protein C0465_25765, partial [Ralstonia sp.]
MAAMSWVPGKAYSDDLRARVLSAVDRGGRVYEVAPLFEVSVSYIYKALARRKLTGIETALPKRGRTYATSYAYDAADNLTLLTYPSGRQVEYLRDTMGRVTTVRTRKPATAAWSNIASGIVYQPLSLNVKSFTHGNGLATTNTHTLDYELSRCRVTDGALALIDKSYTRADKLNITSITDNVAPANSLALGYNKPNRLQSAAGPWGT